jgi:hypothetical protein
MVDHSEMTFQDKEIMPIQVGHRVSYAYKRIWMPNKIKKNQKSQSIRDW